MSLADSFPKRYEPKDIEKKWQNTWENLGLYKFNETRAATSPDEIFSIDTPPPTISGKLHIGHVFSYTHTETIARYKRLRGLNVYYPFGYDDNGVPTELLTEKEKGLRAHQVGRSEFRKICREVGAHYSGLFRDLWKSLGFSCDFDSAYSTISPESQRVSQWSFLDLYHKKIIERRNEPTLWCVKLQTSFSQAEIEVEYIAGKFLHLPFAVEGADPIVIATTRPELLAACVSIFVHPEDERYKAYVGKKARVPVYNHEVPILADPKAQMDKGSGAVMCCTFGDITDVEWWRKHKLPLREAILPNGRMSELTGPLAGLKIEEAKAKIIQILQDQNQILKIVEIKAEDRPVNTYERSGAPVEYIVKPQWFLKVCDYKSELIEAVRKVKWHPESMRYRCENWIENLSWDWAISRQRSFGVPIPAWYRGEEVFVPKVEDLPVDPLETSPPGESSKDWVPDPDVFDTWFTSSVTPLINQRQSLPNSRPYLRPMSMRPQAHDIIRTWAFYTIAKFHFHFGEAPWKHAVISGHVKKPDQQKEGQQLAGAQFAKKTKISKSKDGEKYAPDRIIASNSADGVRLWAAGANLGTDVLFDEGGIAEAQKFLNKLWNASRFALIQLEGFAPNATGCKTLNPEDHWIRGELKKISKHYLSAMDEYETHRAKVELDKFFWMSLCDNYIEFVKCRLQAAKSEEEKNSAKQTLYEVLLQTLKLYAPFAPHITEEIYSLAFRAHEKAESIHQLKIDVNVERNGDEIEAEASGRELVALVGAIRLSRSKAQVGFRVPTDQFQIFAKPEVQSRLKVLEPVFLTFASAQKCDYSHFVDSLTIVKTELEGLGIKISFAAVNASEAQP